MVTDRHQVPRGRRLTDVVRECVDGGARAVLLRERDLDPTSYDRAADTITAALEPVGGVLVVRDSARAHPDHGVHLRSGDPLPRTRHRLLGRSVHDPAGLAAARTAGLDYVTYSPVAPTESKLGYGPALGASGVRRAVAAVSGAPAVLALGGVQPLLVQDLLRAGAHGVAVMGSVMRSDDPGRLVHDLLQHIHQTCPTTHTEESPA
ncbi:thiamine phosphate synthase [Luteipulveratus flavus]|uniref:Thiamine phosphate synthase n=1 Tax=Luteipulveratus flavus TaxID=3031728 RepID=A0ABT6CAI7_9MICO|nr:thiamine phosphate synthase [Luteipulveratus sp. YIM 133296]MDF8265905.1 thiamine phosphate synthase [Luteipulveratus sp. YIM 133296]